MRLKTARELGMRLREAREDQGLTQEELAERIGASRRWVWEMEKGKETLHLGLVLKAISALRLTFDVRPRMSALETSDGPELAGVLARMRESRP